jgi:peptidoglycan/LPS O-acetylase OafA/YrhL
MNESRYWQGEVRPAGVRAAAAPVTAPSPTTGRAPRPAATLRRDQADDAAGFRSLDLAYDSRRNNFGFLRFFLATMVIWSHSYALSGRPADPVWALSGQIDGGSVAVDGFFVLSGFLVTQSWMQQPALRAFAIKRLLRIVPALVVATMFGAFLIAPLAATVPVADYFRSAEPWLHFVGVPLNRYLFIPSAFPDNPYPHLLNSPLWSLRYELFCYALLGVLGALCGRQLGRASIALFVVSWLAYLCVPRSVSPLSILSQTPRLVACFSVGMILFAYRRQIALTPRWALAAGFAVTVTLVFGGLRSTLPWAGGYLLIYFVCLNGLRLENFARHGDFSYGLYIFACPIQQLLIHRLGTQLPVAVFFVLAYLPTLVLAVLSWHLIEAPALRLKKTVAGRR